MGTGGNRVDTITGRESDGRLRLTFSVYGKGVNASRAERWARQLHPTIRAWDITRLAGSTVAVELPAGHRRAPALAPAPRRATMPSAKTEPTGVTCRAQWEAGATYEAGRCQEPVLAKGCCAGHYRSLNRAKTEAAKKKALATPIRARSAEPNKRLSVSVPGPAFKNLERIAKARGFASVYALHLDALLRLAQEKP